MRLGESKRIRKGNSRSLLTSPSIVFVLRCRRQEAGKSCFQSVVRTEDINVHHGFEPVGAELANWRKEIASSSSTSKNEKNPSPGGLIV